MKSVLFECFENWWVRGTLLDGEFGCANLSGLFDGVYTIGLGFRILGISLFVT